MHWCYLKLNVRNFQNFMILVKKKTYDIVNKIK